MDYTKISETATLVAALSGEVATARTVAAEAVAAYEGLQRQLDALIESMAGPGKTKPAQGSSRRRPGHLTAVIVSAIGDGHTRAIDIAHAAGITPASTAEALGRLVAAGRVLRTGRGMYALPNGNGQPREEGM